MGVFKAVVLLACSLVTVAAATATLERLRVEEVFLRLILQCAAMPLKQIETVPRLVQDLQRVLQSRWPGSQVIPFGSIIAGVSIRGSDVDCFVQLPSSFQPSNLTVMEAKDVLAQHPQLFHRLSTIPAASVPLVQFTHSPTSHRCDVSFRSADGIRSTQMLKYLMNLDNRALQLAIIIKYWAREHRPRQAKRIMPNYAMVNLVVFFLQQVSILPAIIQLQENADKVMVSNWETGFNQLPYRSLNNDTLVELLAGFFKFYANFDFENMIISPYTGTVMERRMFENVDTIPKIFDTYKRNVAMNVTKPLAITRPLCIQDFFVHRDNIGAETSKEVLENFQSNLKFADEIISEERDDSLEYIFYENNKCFRTSILQSNCNSTCRTC